MTFSAIFFMSDPHKKRKKLSVHFILLINCCETVYYSHDKTLFLGIGKNQLKTVFVEQIQ